MKPKRPPIPVLVLLALVILVGGYFLVVRLVEREEDTLSASGTIEATSIALAPEIGGRVQEVYVDEGDPVQLGDPLFRLDDTLLQAQRQVAETTLALAEAAAQTALRAQETAQANYTIALSAARTASNASRTADWATTGPAPYTLPGGYFTQNEMLVAAAAEVEAARSARDEAQSAVNDSVSDPANAGFIAAESRLAQARLASLVAQDVLARASLSTGADLRQAARDSYDLAQDELEAAQAAWDDLSTSEAASSLINARLGLALAQERYEAAQDRSLALQTGIYSPQVAAAQAVLNQAVEAAAQARLAIAQAQASLDLIDAQVARLTILAPSGGVILTRSLQPGEVVPAGATAMKMARLDDLTITVYIPEDRYGELSLGQSASVSVDSFPGLTFPAVVVHIADEAGFTPRNVQTIEGRSSTVYAVRLQVEDPEGRLKPGMPADVVFED